jgi:hypothetical protein
MIKKYIKKVINSGPVRYGRMFVESGGGTVPFYSIKDRRTPAEIQRAGERGRKLTETVNSVRTYLSKPIEPVLNERKSGWGYEVNPKNPLVKKVKRYISK